MVAFIRGMRAVAIGCAGAAAAFAQTPIAELGKQRAAASPLHWEVREAGHPVLGPIVFAVTSPVATPVGRNQVSSQVYLSCERSTGKIAVELANGTRADDPGGLAAKSKPRLTCRTLADGKPVDEPLEARWTANALGDEMARGLWPSAVRACASIAIAQEVVLPAGWGAPTARVEMEIVPYARELDRVFSRCGEPSAWPLEAAPPPAAKAAPAPQPATAVQPAPATAANGWITARVVADGRTNVRARPDIRSALVIRLDPGDVILVQRSETDWWHARSRPGARVPFEGYIRRDRLAIR